MTERSQPVRFGGGEHDGRFRFELTGGDLALDFVNTLDQRSGSPRELLTEPERLVEWASQTGLLTETEAATVRRHTEHDVQGAHRTLARARQLRETLFGVFEPLSSGEAPEAVDVERLHRWYLASLRATPLHADGEVLVWDRDVGRGLAAILCPVIRSAVGLATDCTRISRLRACAGATCDWLFLDLSRRGNRRWCDMSVCGNRAKVRRFRDTHSGESAVIAGRRGRP